MTNKILNNKHIEVNTKLILYIILGVTTLVFAAFYLFGYDTPFVNDASFNAPLLTDGILIWIYVLIICATAIMLYSLYSSIKKIKLEGKIVNGVPARKITFLVFTGMLLTLLLSFLLGSTTSMQINGEIYSDKFWLQVTDMFVNTILIMFLVSIGVVVFGYCKSRRRMK